MKVEYKKAGRTNIGVKPGHSVRRAEGPRRLPVRFDAADMKAQDVVILSQPRCLNFTPSLPEWFQASSMLLLIACLCLWCSHTAFADQATVRARHENMQRYYNEQHKPAPTLAEIKVAAEKGDMASQFALAEVYNAQSDFSNALAWYLKAAQKGHTNAQYLVGDMLLNGRIVKATGAAAFARDPNEAVSWLGRAANQGHVASEVALGNCYRDGIGVSQDSVEAFKWFALAAKQTNNVAKENVRDLTLKLRSDEVAAGQARADSFIPGKETGLPEPAYLTKLKLNGISGIGDKRLAIVNNRTLALNEDAAIKLDNKTVEVKCLEIKADSVILQVGPYRKELQYRD